MMLVLCLVTFVVLAAGEARAAEQPSQTTQPSTLHSTMINGKVAEPVTGATPPVQTPPVQTPPVQTPPVQTPLPPTNEAPPVEEPSPPPPTNETPPAKEPSPPPVDPAPSTPETDPAPQPTSQWFAVAITDGEIVESDPVLTSWSTTDSEQTPDVAYPTPGSAAPVEDSGSSVPSTSPDAWPLGSTTDEAMPTDQRAAEPFLGPVVFNQVTPEGAPKGAAALLPEPLRGLVPGSVISRDTDQQPVPSVFEKAPAASVPTVPASVGGALRLPSSLGTTAASAVGTVRSMAASVSSATTELLGYLAGGSSGTSSTNSTDGIQEQQPSEGSSQPAPPVAPPAGSGSFSPFTGGGHLGIGGGFAPLLVGILALLATSLLRRDFRTYLISCEMPKPSSALLLPLERPG